MKDVSVGVSKENPDGYKRQLALLFLAVFIDLLGFGIIIPIIPFYLEKLQPENVAITLGWLVASYSIAQFIFSPIFGKLSDRVGRRPVILFGLIGSAIAFAVFGFATSIFVIFISRIMAGVFTAATLPTARAYIADSAPEEKKTQSFALIGIAFGLGFSIGPALGGVLSTLDIFGLTPHAIPSYFAAILSLLNFIGAIIWLPESLTKALRDFPSKARRNLIGSIKYTFSLPNVGIIIISFLAMNFVFSGFEAMFPFFANNVSGGAIREKEIGYIFGIIGVFMIIVQGGLLRPLSKRYDDITLIRIGLALLAIGFFFLPFANSFWTISIAALPMSAGVAIISPAVSAGIAKRTPAEYQGEVMGANSGLNSLTRIFGPLIAGFLFEFNIFWNLIMGFVVVSLALISNYKVYDSSQEIISNNDN